MLQTRPRLSDAARHVLRASMLRSVGTTLDARDDAADDRAVQGVLDRLRRYTDIDELVDLYHFQRGTLTRWAAADLQRGARPSPAAAVDAAVRLRVAELLPAPV